MYRNVAVPVKLRRAVATDIAENYTELGRAG